LSDVLFANPEDSELGPRHRTADQLSPFLTGLYRGW